MPTQYIKIYGVIANVDVLRISPGSKRLIVVYIPETLQMTQFIVRKCSHGPNKWLLYQVSHNDSSCVIYGFPCFFRNGFNTLKGAVEAIKHFV